MNILNLLLIIPVLSIAGVLLTKDLKGARLVAAIGTGAQLLASLVITALYLQQRAAGNTAEFLFQSDTLWYSTLNIHYFIGVDSISLSMIVLTALVVFSGVFISWKMEYLSREFFILLILLSIGSYGFFISLDLFTMFLFYEMAVVPKFLLIGIWGSGKKEYAAMKLTLVLMVGSALVIVGLLGLYTHSGDNQAVTFSLVEMAKIHFPAEVQSYFFPFLFVGFGILGALFPFHSWSPDGHSSAPTAVSMLAAGVLMKLGGYGCLRVAMYLLPQAANEMAWIFLILTTISLVYGALTALSQKDLKYINAFSSVSHCGLVLFGLLLMNGPALTGAVMQMFSHGLMTSLFFALIGMIYTRTHTRMVDKMGGLLKIMPFIAVAFIITGLASLGLPGLSGFVAEMSIFVGAFQKMDAFHITCGVIACISILLTAVYILQMVGKIMMGPVADKEHEELTDAVWYEKTAIYILLVPMVLMGVAPLVFSNAVLDSVKPIVERLTAMI